MQDLLRRLGVSVHFIVKTDSSAVVGIGRRLGAGILRYFEVEALWAQQLFKDNRLVLQKCKGETNPADLGTQAHNAKTLRRLIAKSGLSSGISGTIAGVGGHAAGSELVQVLRIYSQILARSVDDLQRRTSTLR